ncbi:MAG: hypothetical protein EXS05_17505 [Planctomycetaceae bacterium]|nr:hypothetical protein [Planctomycetaceae bacterium]
MALSRIVSRIKSGSIFPYVLGRFLFVRNAYSVVKRVTSKGEPPASLDNTLFPQIVPEHAVASLRTNALAFGFNLPADVVREIREYAENILCKRTALPTEFYFRDIRNGRLPDGTEVALAQVNSPRKCPAIKRIEQDPMLLKVCSDYLGYPPKSCHSRLFWSPASDLGDEERRKLAQTIDFHVDAYSYNFCYVNFYITDCDNSSGAHEMILGSHKNASSPEFVGEFWSGEVG